MENKSIKDSSARESKDKEPMSLIDIMDAIDHCNRKVTFINEVFTRKMSSEELFSESARTGFHFIMDDLEDDLEDVVNQLMEIDRKMREDRHRIQSERRGTDAAQPLQDAIEAARSAGKI